MTGEEAPAGGGPLLARSVAGPLLLLALLPGCQHAQNYLDPRGPAYAGDHAGPLPIPTRTPGTLRIVTFNIEYALRVDRALVALGQHRHLRGADLLALQEMDAPGTSIARALGLNYVYYPASLHPKHRRDLGNAILSPWPIEASFKLPLPHLQPGGASGAGRGGRPRPRGGAPDPRLFAAPRFAPGRERRAAPRPDRGRALPRPRQPDPVVIAGDFNSKGSARSLVAAGYSWLTRDVGSSTRIFSFDHVFVRGLAFRDATAGVASDVRDASDHRPVWAELKIAVD